MNAFIKFHYIKIRIQILRVDYISLINKSSNIILDLNLKEAKEKELFLNKNMIQTHHI